MACMKAIKHSMSRFLATGFSIKADIKRDKKNDRSGSRPCNNSREVIVAAWGAASSTN
jgi:hypothetical protein